MIGGAGVVSPESMANQLRRAQNINSSGEAFATLDCAWNASQLVPGEYVDLELSRTPDTKGGRLTSGRGMVVSRRLNPNAATVTLVVRIMEAARVIAPVCVVSAVSTTTNTNDTLTCATADDTDDPDLTSVVDALAATWQVYFLDVTDNTQKGPYTVSSVDQGTDKVILTADPTPYVPAVGDVMYPAVNAATPAAVSTLDEDDFSYMTTQNGDNEGGRFS
jgi:hypothetical protein